MSNKLIAIADYHIYDWPKYSVYGTDGVPSRLNHYLTLAQRIVQYGKHNDIKLLVIAGDTLQASTVRPMVLNIAKQVFQVFLSHFKVVVILGQHDLDVKSDHSGSTYTHSVISSILPNDPNLTYVFGEKEFEVDGLKFHARSWKPDNNYDLGDTKADVFVGHGSVVGCVDPYGYDFKKGFEQNKLLSNYKLSIIGDIHQAQVFQDTSGNKVLIPGQPLQSNFSSGYPCGIWVCDVGGTTTDLSFVPVHELDRNKEFCYFVQEPNPDLYDYANVFVKEQKSKSKSKKSGINSSPKVKANLHDLLLKQIDSLVLNNKEDTLAFFDKLYTSVKGSNTRPVLKPSAFTSVTISNFLSIKDELKLEFGKTENGTILLYGTNGSGKTSVVEAIYWALTGELTKTLSVSDINCDFGNEPAKVTLNFTVEGYKYSVVRSRKAGELLKLYKEDTDLTKSTAKDTQELIYSILGVTASDIKLLLYFSLNELSLFSSLTTTGQLEVISGLAQIELLSEISSLYKEEMMEANLRLRQEEGANEVVRNQIETLKAKKKAIEADIAIESAYAIDVPSLEAKIKLIDNEIESEYNKLEGYNLELQTLSNNKSSLDKIFAEYNTAIKYKSDLVESMRSVATKLKQAKAGTCHECGQILHDETVVNKLNKELANVTAKLKGLVIPERPSEEQYLHIEAERDSFTDLKNKSSGTIRVLKDKKEGLQEEINKNKNLGMLPAKLEAIQDQLNSLIKDYNPEVYVSLKSKQEDYNKLSAILARNNKNPVYLQSIESTYQELVDILNYFYESNNLPYKVCLNKKFELEVEIRGKLKSVQALSGGEKRLFDLFVLLSLSRLYQQNYGLDRPFLNLVIFDEVLVYLSPENLNAAHHAITELEGTKLVVSNDSGLQGLFEHKMMVKFDESSGSTLTILE